MISKNKEIDYKDYLKKNKKIDCKDCKRTCCDNMRIEKGKEEYGIGLKKGSLLYVKGIIWKKKANGLWSCIAFDSQKKACKIWKYRPPLCRYYFCQFAKKKKRIKLINQEEYENEIDNNRYRLVLKACSYDLLKGDIRDYNITKKITIKKGSDLNDRTT